MLFSGAVDSDCRRRFEARYAEQYASSFAYVYRRLTGAVLDAPDVVSEVCGVAWRWLDEIAPAGEARLRLRALARHVRTICALAAHAA